LHKKPALGTRPTGLVKHEAGFVSRISSRLRRVKLRSFDLVQERLAYWVLRILSIIFSFQLFINHYTMGEVVCQVKNQKTGNGEQGSEDGGQKGNSKKVGQGIREPRGGDQGNRISGGTFNSERRTGEENSLPRRHQDTKNP